MARSRTPLVTTAIESRSAPGEVVYPERDGEPLGETSIHVEETIAVYCALRDRYAGVPRVSVIGDMLVYFVEGDPTQRFSPDVAVVLGADERARRVYKVWEEGPPTVVIELSSRGTWLEDAGNKKALCARLGVREYFLVDPEADYLDPPVQGYRLAGEDYLRIAPRRDGTLPSAALGLRIGLRERHVQLVDSASGEVLARPIESMSELRSMRARAQQEAERAEKAEAEVARLRAQLTALDRGRRRAPR